MSPVPFVPHAKAPGPCASVPTVPLFVIEGLRVPVRLSPSVHPLVEAALFWARHTCTWVRVTSGNDHTHAPNSRHYTNEAVDFVSADLRGLTRFLSGLGYRTLYDVPGHYHHVHVELPTAPERP